MSLPDGDMGHSGASQSPSTAVKTIKAVLQGRKKRKEPTKAQIEARKKKKARRASAQYRERNLDACRAACREQMARRRAEMTPEQRQDYRELKKVQNAKYYQTHQSKILAKASQTRMEKYVEAHGFNNFIDNFHSRTRMCTIGLIGEEHREDFSDDDTPGLP
ncbi:hypothetical protein VNI00_008987 [Paramarasmius palmivorus]|uniref:Uncharacterized protein n=1 Tax=Paramarasmius palmivorus TaxID=297713 RepID=A0AAW0CSD7_9AGAR